MRGEYASDRWDATVIRELPPRARRIPQKVAGSLQDQGTTSACAENTTHQKLWQQNQRNYLRVRGEYLPVGGDEWCIMELPPRARRILPLGPDTTRWTGTTSACAENTKDWAESPPRLWNYLRVRGEYSPLILALFLSLELPPRARRIPHRHPHGA